MKRISLWVTIATLAMVVVGVHRVSAEPGVIAGADLGFVAPLKQFKDRATTGGMISPFAGYMLNDYVGAMGQIQFFETPPKDVAGVSDSDRTRALTGMAGPRLALPFGGGEFYATFQAGVVTGLKADSALSHTSYGYSTGGGLNARITDQLLIGLFGRYNWVDQRTTGTDGSRDNVEYLTGGISLTYNLVPKPAAPPPAPVAQAPAAPAPPPAKRKIVLRGVNFDFDKSNIRADAKPVLDEAIATLKQEGGIAVIAEGHTDSKGTDEYNQGLSVRRAKAVRDYLVAGGIAPARITAEGFGESRPVASNKTDDGRAQNRRVELRITGE